ncbi:NAD(P)-dependent oxidoreductase [Nocardioides anomalus]|uniref:NAD(P)-dependent oxidoreductase n=1 Tax=Nocardioides anomalus TaxID=2712223 RepID=A0A6G6WMC7_9ACTN|nr:NAD(P)-dependent oxidoreductase [Nocardioides anomalus]
MAVLGTGKMGAGMARQLVQHGFDVRVWNRSRDKAEPLAEDGATVADSATEAVRGAEVVLPMLFDADSVLAVLDEAADGFGQGVLLVQSTTVGLEQPRVADAARSRGLRVLDAPVLGTRKPAEEGKLTVLASGDPADRDEAQPVLDAIGAKTVWVGDEVGMASRLKLACNAWVASITAATAQSVALAEGLGLDPRLFLHAIEGSPTDAAYAQLKGDAMISGEMPVAFDVDGISKDLGLIRQAADEGGVSAELLEALQGLFRRASEQGHGGADMAAVRKAF